MEGQRKDEEQPPIVDFSDFSEDIEFDNFVGAARAPAEFPQDITEAAPIDTSASTIEDEDLLNFEDLASGPSKSTQDVGSSNVAETEAAPVITKSITIDDDDDLSLGNVDFSTILKADDDLNINNFTSPDPKTSDQPVEAKKNELQSFDLTKVAETSAEKIDLIEEKTVATEASEGVIDLDELEKELEKSLDDQTNEPTSSGEASKVNTELTEIQTENLENANIEKVESENRDKVDLVSLDTSEEGEEIINSPKDRAEAPEMKDDLEVEEIPGVKDLKEKGKETPAVIDLEEKDQPIEVEETPEVKDREETGKTMEVEEVPESTDLEEKGEGMEVEEVPPIKDLEKDSDFDIDLTSPEVEEKDPEEATDQSGPEESPAQASPENSQTRTSPAISIEPMDVDDMEFESAPGSPKNDSSDSNLKEAERDDEELKLTEDVELLSDQNNSTEAPPAEELNEETVEETKNSSDSEAPKIEKPAVLPETESLNISELVRDITNLDDESNHSENNLVIDEPGKTPEKLPTHAFVKTNCMNSACRSTTDLFVAPSFVCNFYTPSLASNKKYFVCQACFDVAVERFESYCSALTNGKPVLKMELPINEEIVELSDDSDDEDSSSKEDDPPLSKETLELIENELEEVLNQQLAKVNIDQQVSWAHEMLGKKMANNFQMSVEITEELRELEKAAYEMNRKLHSVAEVRRISLPPLDISTIIDQSFYRERYELPGTAEMMRPPIDCGSTYYAVKLRLLAAWVPATVVDTCLVEDTHQYRITYSQTKNYRVVSGKYLAYSHPPPGRLKVGDRVIALFNNEDNQMGRGKRDFFPGIIAEPLQPYNGFRYLIFFDDGYTQYVHHQDVRLVCEASLQPSLDVHPHAKDFIEDYLKTFRNKRPLVQVKRGQRMITEYKGNWHQAKVLEFEASLVKVYFDNIRKSEWIYRGSTRLGPIYRTKQSGTIPHSIPSATTRRNEPSVEYVSIGDDEEKAMTSSGPRAVARKSSAGPLRRPALSDFPQSAQQRVRNLNNSTIILEDDIGKGSVKYFRTKNHVKLAPYKVHECSPQCIIKRNMNLSKYSPIAKPLMCGWERQVAKNKRSKIVNYKAPCGRRLRNIGELYMFLLKTECPLGIECFEFDLLVHCLATYVVEKSILNIEDISEGQEGIPVPCINYFDDSRPPPLKYSAVRIPTDGVNLNLDPAFLCGCDCVDGCLDKTRCACQRLTIEGARFCNPNLRPEQVGYEYKRLYNHVRTGIYECNSQCHCAANCLNRVVQQPLSNMLQVFKTNNRGWGLRTINDIPRGTFICVYAGNLLTEQAANENGKEHGDEYFADLDYIEIAEETKQGYESDVPDLSDDSDNYEPDNDDDYVSTAQVSRGLRVTRQSLKKVTKQISKKTTKRSSTNSTPTQSDSGVDDENSNDRERINLLPHQMGAAEDMPTVDNDDKSFRKMFGKDESVYVMDAKVSGNIGRYFNHSCEPNMFVQNVFVDTHDLRFPWIAFFAECYIPAGKELTWNYNYEVGSVSGKVLYCSCGAPNCRQRLL